MQKTTQTISVQVSESSQSEYIRAATISIVTLPSILVFTFFMDFAVFSEVLVARPYHPNKSHKVVTLHNSFQEKDRFYEVCVKALGKWPT